MESTISIIAQKRYTKLSSLYLYFYICLNESFRNLTENSEDIENIGSFIKEEPIFLNMDNINDFLDEQHISNENCGMGIILFKIRYDDEKEEKLENLWNWFIDNGYIEEDPLYIDEEDSIKDIIY